MLTGLNHITLAVSDIERSLAFYTEVLGFVGRVKWQSGAYLSVGECWLCLSLGQVEARADYTHYAFDIDEENFESFVLRAETAGLEQWQQNRSEGKSLYILDPDGHKLEIHAGSLQTRLQALKSQPYTGLVWL